MVYGTWHTRTGDPAEWRAAVRVGEVEAREQGKRQFRGFSIQRCHIPQHTLTFHRSSHTAAPHNAFSVPLLRTRLLLTLSIMISLTTFWHLLDVYQKSAPKLKNAVAKLIMTS